MLRPPQGSTLFPYTTLFRSLVLFDGQVVFDRRGVREFDRHGPGLGDEFANASPVDRKSTRLNSSHPSISYAVFCLKKKTNTPIPQPQHTIRTAPCDQTCQYY